MMKTPQQVDILLVEDQLTDEELARHALSKTNLADDIKVARDGAEALEYLFNEQDQPVPASQFPVLILLDLKLPKIHGLEVLEKIKSNQATRTIPVVVLSSSDQEQDIITSYQLGANSYITKPVDYQEYSAAIQQIGSYWLSLNQRLPS
jgi:two-component system response regulator